MIPDKLVGPIAPSILLCTQYLEEGRGGISSVARLTGKALAERYEVNGLACMDTERARLENVHTHAFRNSRTRFLLNMAYASRKTTHIFYDFAGTARAHPVVWPGHKPYAVWAHGYEVWDEPRTDYARSIERADLVLVNSRYTMQRAEKTLRRTTRAKLCELGSSTDVFPRIVCDSKDPPTVLLLGRMDHGLPKGHDILISVWPKVVKAVSSARLLLAGGGEAFELVRSLAKASEAAASIEVKSFVPNDQLVNLWHEASIFAMPGRAEGFGLVYIEAMRRGIPIVASTEDAGQEINLDGRTGFNVSRNSPELIADTIVALLRDRDLAAHMGASGQALWRERYSYSAFAQRFHQSLTNFLE